MFIVSVYLDLPFSLFLFAISIILVPCYVQLVQCFSTENEKARTMAPLGGGFDTSGFGGGGGCGVLAMNLGIHDNRNGKGRGIFKKM